MTLAKRLLAIAAALLQLTLPLAAYGRAPGIPGANDLCSAVQLAHHGNPAGQPHHVHCALCAHANPPALPVSTPVQPPPAHVDAAPDETMAFALPAPLRRRANARAPPRIELEPA